MDFETLEINRNEDIFTIYLNRPEVHNAMNEKLMKELTFCFKQINKDRKIKIIVLTGKGKSFCAGADLNWMKRMTNFSKNENIEDSRILLNLYDSIYSCSKPVICSINGNAFGGGIGLIAVSDISISPPGYKFAFTETKLGIIPSVISTYIVRRIGLSNLKRLFITGERFSSEYAKDIGLIDFTVTENDIEVLERISPIHKVDKIQVPLFIIQGDNDERVPLSESIQIYESVKKRGLKTELLRYSDEGHGLAKLENRIDAYTKVLNWLLEIV